MSTESGFARVGWGGLITQYASLKGWEDFVLEGNVGLVFGVANRRSIAWGIGQALAGAGARLGFTYEAERVKDTVTDLVATLPDAFTLPCNVLDDA